jgi:hypothetical protein
LASIGDTTVSSAPLPQPDETETESGLDFGATQSLSFHEALNISTDATTKGFVRLDRLGNGSSSTSLSPMDTSDVTFLSKTTAELMAPGNNLSDCLFGTFAKQAKETLREVASVDEADCPVRGVVTNDTIHHKSASGSIPGEGSVSFFTSIGNYFQSLLDDLQKLGLSIGTNLDEANRAVVETMSFTEDEVDGMLKVLETELGSTRSKHQTTTEPVRIPAASTM